MLWKRLALVPAGVLLGLLVLEGGLQAAAFVMQKVKGDELPVSWVTGDLRVLCLGDSNTYGLWLGRHEAYPQQLEAVWNSTIESPKLEVLNLGFPGTNSSSLVRNLPRLLETFTPDILIIMVGVNDFWTLPFPLDDALETRPRKNFILRHSLIYRLYYLISRGRRSGEVESVLDRSGTLKGAAHKARFGDVEFDMGFVRAQPGTHGDREALDVNLRTLVELARDAGTRLYLMTYASRFDFYSVANPVISKAAADTNTPLIDLTPVFEPICPEKDCEILFPDHHPRAPGYKLIAETVVKQLSASDSP